MRVFALLLAFCFTAPAFAATINNDDSCDVALQPAATLLLPYFEVDINSPAEWAMTTLFTIQNVSSAPQIVSVTLWTDLAYPALTFPVFLTGYGVTPINLRDILVRGVIVQGAFPGGPVPLNPTPGSQPQPNNGNPNFLPDAASACAVLPTQLSPPLLTDLQSIFTTGKSNGNSVSCPLASGAQAQIGSVHTDAVGYVTIDLVATCSRKNPTTPGYFDTLLFDNVLTGDYQIVVPRAQRSYAQGGPFVHIRAIPEGGPAGSIVSTPLPYTFYDRFTTGAMQRTVDRRQPLPSTFAARYIGGGPNAFNSSFTIWREGVTGANTECKSYVSNSTPYAEIVRFDEHENATINSGICCILPPPPPTLPTTVTLANYTSFFPPPSTSGDVAGWLYMNWNNGVLKRASQNWVVASLFAEPTYAAGAAAIALGNGCSAATPANAQVGPAKNANP